MLGSALGRQHTTKGLKGEKQLARLIGIPTMPCGHLPNTQNPPLFPHWCSDFLAWIPPLPPALILLPQHLPNLLFKIFPLEGEQESAHMILAQLINAAGIDGTAQELIHLILRVQGVLCPPAEGRRYGLTRCTSMAMLKAMRRERHGQAREEGV